MTRAGTIAVAIALVLALAGCSFFMKTNPSGWDPSQQPTCSDSRVAPNLDAVGAVVGMLAGLAGVMAAPQCEENRARCEVGALIPVAAGVVYMFSGVTGVHRVKRCREAKEAWLRSASQARPD